MNLMLTSAGLENPRILNAFVPLLPCAPEQARALFIPTAAVTCEAIEVLPKCLEDLYRAGISRSNIDVCDLHEALDEAVLSRYTCIYLCGGDSAHLLRRLNESGTAQALLRYLRGPGAVVGVSAGSIVFAGNLPGNLGLLSNPLHVHCPSGSPAGPLPPAGCPVLLTNARAVLFSGRDAPRLIE